MMLRGRNGRRAITEDINELRFVISPSVQKYKGSLFPGVAAL